MRVRPGNRNTEDIDSTVTAVAGCCKCQADGTTMTRYIRKARKCIQHISVLSKCDITEQAGKHCPIILSAPELRPHSLHDNFEALNTKKKVILTIWREVPTRIPALWIREAKETEFSRKTVVTSQYSARNNVGNPMEGCHVLPTNMYLPVSSGTIHCAVWYGGHSLDFSAGCSFLAFSNIAPNTGQSSVQLDLPPDPLKQDT